MVKLLDIHSKAYFSRIDQVAQEVITLLSETMDVNTIFLASNDQYSNFIVKAFNRKAQLLHEGETTPFKDVLCKLVVENEFEPIVITDLKTNPLTLHHPVTRKVGNGCFLGAPIFHQNGEIFGTICAFDTRPYEFSAYDVRLIKTLSSLLSQTIMLEDQMLHDHLTGLYNPLFIRGFFEQSMMDNVMKNQQFSLLYVDLDHFKQINDTFGHDIGDQLLKRVAAMLVEQSPQNSIVARIGGDEFVLFVPVSSWEMFESTETALRLINTFNRMPFEIDGHVISISASVGMTYMEPGKELQVLLKEADMAMYDTKRNGRNSFKVYQ